MHCDPTRLAKNGFACLYEDDAVALARLDAMARECVAAPDVREWQVSSLIDEEDMIRCGYISAFPGQLTAAATVDPAAYDRVVGARRVESGDLCHRHKFLTPAACLNLYPMLGRLGWRGNVVITTLATVFRHETHFEDLVRLWEFKVREFVFAGDETFVLKGLERTAEAAERFARRLGLSTRISSASDHFYPSVENNIRRQLQIRGAMKKELVARIADQDVALASFNFHRAHFSAPYGFDEGSTVVTGCVGFGLHRWLAAYRAALLQGSLARTADPLAQGDFISQSVSTN